MRGRAAARERAAAAQGRAATGGRAGRLAAGVAAVLVAALVGCGGTAADPPSPTGVTPLPPGGFDYQIGGPYPPAPGVAVVARDRTAPPAPGIYSICYLNAYQTQPEETARWRAEHPGLVLGVEDPDWPGEFLLDISTPERRRELAGIVGGWIDGCAAADYRAVEPDNLDSWTRSGGRLTEADALAYAALLIARAHVAGLAIGQKNSAELGDRGRAAGFDFAVTEECAAFGECADYTDVYGRAVLEVEYDPRAFARACGVDHPVVLRDRDVLPAGTPGHVRRTC